MLFLGTQKYYTEQVPPVPFEIKKMINVEMFATAHFLTAILMILKLELFPSANFRDTNYWFGSVFYKVTHNGRSECRKAKKAHKKEKT
jgi:hypothetical protein